MAAFRVGKPRVLAIGWPAVALLLLTSCTLGYTIDDTQDDMDEMRQINKQMYEDLFGKSPEKNETAKKEELLLKAAISYIKNQAPGREYKAFTLQTCQVVLESPSGLFHLQVNMEPTCNTTAKVCSTDLCFIDLQEDPITYEPLTIPESVHCRYLIPGKEPTEADFVEIDEEQVTTEPSFDHEVQTSAGHNDRPFIAVRANQSTYCPGCPYELNPSLPGLSAFGDQVLTSMDDAGVSDFKHKLISIVRVTRAVPPGSNVIQYQLLMEIGESNCLRTSLIQISECPLQSNLQVKLCLVTFEEHLHQIDSRKIIKNNCTELINTDNEVSASIDPNSLLFEPSTPYTEDDFSTKTEFYDQIAQEAQEVFRVPYIDVSTIDSIQETEEPATVKELPEFKIVLGTENERPKFTDKLKEFDEFLEDFNVPIKLETTSHKYFGVPVTEDIIIAERVEETFTTNQPNESENSKMVGLVSEKVEQFTHSTESPIQTSKRSKRSTLKGVENNKLLLRKLAVKAVELLDAVDDDNKRKHVIDVIDYKRERQDHGIVYFMTVEVAATDCSENDKSTECLDEVLPGPTQICKLDVVTNEKKPLQTPKLLHYNCKTQQKLEMRFKRQLVGAPESLSRDDPIVSKFVQLGLRKYSETLEGTNEPIAVNIKDVTYQVVSGLLYKIKTDIGISTCEKGKSENCQLLSNEKVKECIIEAWSRPWLDNGNAKITVKCNENKRRKRSLRGKNYSQKMLRLSNQLKEEKLFNEFTGKYNRKYLTEEEKEKRFNIFKKNLDMIEELQRNEQGTGTYGITQFADLTKDEFTSKYLGLKPSLKSENDIPMPMAQIPDIELPTDFDWRHYNAVTPVKDQGQCGSCWAFSVTGNVEGQYAIKHGKLLSLSEQELLDCDNLDSGCNGGLPDTAYRAIENLGGLETESDYPYEGENEKCILDKTKIKVNVLSGLNITSNETQMAQWLVKNGPMSIGINANAMMFYVGGVSHPFKFLCSPDNLDHGVLIVGYGIKTYPIFKKKMPYWLIKNSWGPRWGEQGYYRVYRGDGTCGVNKMVTTAVVA